MSYIPIPLQGNPINIDAGGSLLKAEQIKNARQNRDIARSTEERTSKSFDADSQANLESKQLGNAMKRLSYVGGLLNQVNDPTSYNKIYDLAVNQGFIKEGELPREYDPQIVEGLRQSVSGGLSQLDQRYKEAQINQMNAGGATGVLLDRFKSDPDFGKAYFNKINANKGLTYGENAVETLPGFNEQVFTGESAKSAGKLKGQSNQEDQSSLSLKKSLFPKLEKMVTKLSELSNKATYTAAGRITDVLAKEIGIENEGYLASKEYESIARNEILPLLRDTFGAAFTQKEGDTLMETLADVNASPKAKQRTLEAFINQKKEDINALERKMGLPETNFKEAVPEKGETSGQKENAFDPQQKKNTYDTVPKKGEIWFNHEFVGEDINNPNSWKKLK